MKTLRQQSDGKHHACPGFSNALQFYSGLIFLARGTGGEKPPVQTHRVRGTAYDSA